MVRFLLTFATNLVSSAIALLLAHLILDEWVTVRLAGFLIAVLVFTVAQSVLAPFVFSIARKYASAMLGGIGLVSTFLALFIATLFPGGLQINGLGWVLGPVLVWIVTALGTWILVGIFLKKYLRKRDESKLVQRAAAKKTSRDK